ncbi:hypothetical protein [Klebsiella electrica]|uniref:Tail spike TSP1/Gp66 N-terminal domain-containing protein n=1 Tax=Klebsiella electrica TaxID=1259973 RepID=A0AAJ5UD89_9ENTR|nr:hypothetical protein [Klebsiella electrica]WBW59789.1 hypothetical protein OR613_17345 [Klebsiella electrica]WBW60139.1 hypothetical protein OR613_19240 [Klebsiella electrica]
MAYLPETPEWTTGVYQLEKNDPVRGGVDGPANKPLIDLLKRTAWLKQRYEEAFSGLGWAELGEWAVGLEVTSPSQIVHYQGYWYRYGGALPHTITGASPSLDDHDNWFNLGNDVSLRANLGSGDGAKLLGRCAHFTALRGTEPEMDRQWIVLERIVAGGPVVNAIFTHYVDDTTSADDDYRCIVTAGGKRWHADVTGGAIDIRLAGLLADGSNFGQCSNKIILGELAKIIGGGLSYMQAFTNIFVPSSLSPVFKTEYRITERIIAPTFFGFCSDGDVRITSGLTGNTAIAFKNDVFPGLTGSAAPVVNMQGKVGFDTPGMFELVGGGRNTSMVAGIEVGNTSSGPDVLDARDFILGHIRVREFRYGLKWNPMDAYIIDLGGADLVNNFFNFHSNSDKVNSGERISVKNATFGNAVQAHMYWNTPGQYVTFDDVSLDYAPYIIIFGNRGRGNRITFMASCHVEGYANSLILQEPMSTDWSFYKNSIIFDCPVVGAKGNQSTFASRRKSFAGAYENNNVYINKGVEWPYAESEDQCSLLGYDDPVKDTWSVFVDNRGCTHEPLLTKYEASLNNGLYKFSGSDGGAVTRDGATGLTASVSGGMTAKYSSAYNGLVTLKLTATAVSDTFELRNLDLLMNVDLDDNVWSCISIMMNAITTGTVNFQTKLYHYGIPVYETTYNGSVYATKRSYTYLGSRVGTAKDVTSLLSVTGTPLTTDKYVGVQAKCRFSLNSITSAIGVSPAIVLSGFVGELHIALPAFLTEGTCRKFM